MQWSKKGGIGAGMIVGVIMVLVFLSVLLSVLKSVIPTAATAYYDLSASMTNTTVYGTDAVAFAGDTPGYLGWFWVLGPFVLVILLILGIFGLRGRR